MGVQLVTLMKIVGYQVYPKLLFLVRFQQLMQPMLHVLQLLIFKQEQLDVKDAWIHI